MFQRGGALCCVVKRALLFEAANNRRLVDSDLLRRFEGAAISCLPTVPLARIHLREVFNAQECSTNRNPSCRKPLAVDNLLFWRNFSLKSPENLQELWPDKLPLRFTPTHRTQQVGTRS